MLFHSFKKKDTPPMFQKSFQESLNAPHLLICLFGRVGANMYIYIYITSRFAPRQSSEPRAAESKSGEVQHTACEDLALELRTSCAQQLRQAKRKRISQRRNRRRRNAQEHLVFCVSLSFKEPLEVVFSLLTPFFHNLFELVVCCLASFS